MSYRSGFITVVGRPNVGKSTLLNSLLGDKLLIVSDKPQTTRNRIHCILSGEGYQIVFIDTPGVHKPKSLLGEGMVQTALNTLDEVDVVLFMVEGNEELGGGDRFIFTHLQKVSTPVILVVNKADQAKGDQLAKLEEAWRGIGEFKDIVHISALTGYNVDTLLNKMVALLPEGPQYYPEDMVIDQPERFVVSELVREKILHLTHDEVPHAVAVVVDEMKERADTTVYVRATIYVERESQKGIIIGKQGSMLKAVGEAARKDIERLLGSKTFLDLWVKTKKDWRNETQQLRQLGYDEYTRRG